MLLRDESPLTADFRRFYGVRIKDALEDPDEFLSLVEWLPPDSAYFTVRRAGGDYGKARAAFGWSFTEDVMWNVLQAVIANTHTTAQAASTKKLPELRLPDHPVDGSAKPKAVKGSASSMARAMMQAAKSEVDPPESV